MAEASRLLFKQNKPNEALEVCKAILKTDFRNIPAPALGNPDPIRLHAEAHNALAMAVHYLTQPRANVPGAARKAVQALAALRKLDVSTTAGSAS